LTGTETANSIQAFLNSARFSPDPEFLSEEDAKGYRIGYLIGKIIAPILLLGVVLAAISYANRRKQRV